MVMNIIHIHYITYLVTNDAWHAYNVIGIYKIHHEAGPVSYLTGSANTVVGWYVHGRSQGP